jgi:hypothetical protein
VKFWNAQSDTFGYRRIADCFYKKDESGHWSWEVPNQILLTSWHPTHWMPIPEGPK